MKIPKLWKEAELGDILLQPESGYSPVLEDSRPIGDELGVLKLSAIVDGSVKVDDAKRAPRSVLNTLKCSLKDGGIIVTRSNTPELVGAVGIVKKDHPNRFLPDLMWQTFVKDSSRVDPGWLAMNLSSTQYRPKIVAAAAGTSGSMKKITKKSFLRLKVLLPPLAEQRRIAEILSTWDAAIEQTEKLLDAKQRRKRALMQQLLTGKQRFREFQGEGWKKAKFGDFMTESRLPGSNGASAKKMSVKLYGLGVNPKSETRMGSKNTKYFRRKAGQFVYSKLDFLNGAFGIVPLELDGWESTLDLPCFDLSEKKIVPTFLLSYVTREEFYENCIGFAMGGRKARRVSPSEFMAMSLKLPSLPEQQKIATVLNTADQEIVQLKDQLAALRKQKQGLMQVLLTGKVRVKVGGNINDS
ncbi:MAG: restriction endonuclease subunit S [Candidatus Sumerlaeia bacterium]|nr:restriction endonuclease subunit S [Candidatus Sumerlaeia bacterium]